MFFIFSSTMGYKQFPHDTKKLILHRMAMWNFSLWPGSKKGPKAHAQWTKKWEELKDYCMGLDAPRVQGVQDVKNLFESWKSTFRTKCKSKKKSGAKPGRPFTEADKILDNLLQENPYHTKKQVSTMITLSRHIDCWWFITILHF